MNDVRQVTNGLNRLHATQTIHALVRHLGVVRSEVAANLGPRTGDDVDQELLQAEQALHNAIDRILKEAEAMRLPRRRRVAPDRISVRELVAYGLSRRPRACGIYWPDSQITMCREHLDTPQTRQMLEAVRAPSDTATLLTGDELARKVPTLCALEHDSHPQ